MKEKRGREKEEDRKGHTGGIVMPREERGGKRVKGEGEREKEEWMLV